MRSSITPTSLSRRIPRSKILLPLMVSGVIACLGVIAAWVMVKGIFMETFEDWGVCQSFDQTVWMDWANKSDPHNPRYCMVDELQERLLQARPTQAEVLTLLGEPDAGKSDTSLGYNLGASGFGVDYDYLIIYFGEDGRVSEVRIVPG